MTITFSRKLSCKTKSKLGRPGGLTAQTRTLQVLSWSLDWDLRHMVFPVVSRHLSNHFSLWTGSQRKEYFHGQSSPICPVPHLQLNSTHHRSAGHGGGARCSQRGGQVSSHKTHRAKDCSTNNDCQSFKFSLKNPESLEEVLWVLEAV